MMEINLIEDVAEKARGDEAPTHRENATRVEFRTLRGKITTLAS